MPEEPAPPRAWEALPASFFARPVVEVAPELLNTLLVRGDRALRIVEVEAYGGAEDPGSHGHRGPTARNRTMFGPPGRLYVYFIYGMHWCANVVCGREGEAAAVLLRAGAPVRGEARMWEARAAARRSVDLASGPARLCQAMGIDGTFDGIDLVSNEAGLYLAEDGTPPPAAPERSTRVGLRAGAELPWRFCVPGDPNVSSRRQGSRTTASRSRSRRRSRSRD